VLGSARRSGEDDSEAWNVEYVNNISTIIAFEAKVPRDASNCLDVRAKQKPPTQIEFSREMSVCPVQPTRFHCCWQLKIIKI